MFLPAFLKLSNPFLTVQNPNIAKRSITKLLKELRTQIVPLTDLVPLSNRGFGQLGNEDLQVYHRVIQHMKATPGVTERAEWWKLAYANN